MTLTYALIDDGVMVYWFLHYCAEPFSFSKIEGAQVMSYITVSAKSPSKSVHPLRSLLGTSNSPQIIATKTKPNVAGYLPYAK